MLLVFDDVTALGSDFVQACLPLLSAQRREKVFAYHFASDQNLSAAVYLLLRYALITQYRIGEAVVFAFGPQGKPLLRDYPRVHISLSHCRVAVACAVGDAALGVDVEEIAPVQADVAKRVLTPDEYRAVLASNDPARLFCEFWAKKESILKQAGRGIGDGLHALAANSAGTALFLGTPHYCCCAAGPVGKLCHIGRFQEVTAALS